MFMLKYRFTWYMYIEKNVSIISYDSGYAYLTLSYSTIIYTYKDML